MLAQVIVNFDDVIFPTCALKRFFRHDSCTFDLPAPMQDQLVALDHLIHRWLHKHLDHTRFKLVTRAPHSWVHACLRLMPQVQRYVQWRYLDLVVYDDTTRQLHMHRMLQHDVRYDLYAFLGYEVDEAIAIPDSLKQCAHVYWRMLVFVRKPTLAALLFEWGHMEAVFGSFLTDRAIVLRNHFVVADDCQQAYASPGWYPPRPGVLTLPAQEGSQGSSSSAAAAGGGGGPVPPTRLGPESPCGVFTLPGLPVMQTGGVTPPPPVAWHAAPPLDKTLRRLDLGGTPPPPPPPPSNPGSAV